MKPAGLKTADPKPATFHRFRIVAETPPHPSTSEVGRFLRKRHVRGHGLPQNRTAWRSILICEARRNGGFIGLHSGFPPQTPPYPSTSEVGRFLRKRHVGRHGPPQSRTAWRSVLIHEARRSTSRVVPLPKRNDSMGSVVLAASSSTRGSLKVSL